MPGFDVNLTITNIQEALDANLRAIAELEPEGEFGEAVRDATIMLHRYAVSITHVGTYVQMKGGGHRSARAGEAGVGGGALRASHRMEVDGLHGRVFIDPSSVNPRSAKRPVEYGVYEHNRGGAHAFYDRTIREYGDTVADATVRRVGFAVVRAYGS